MFSGLLASLARTALRGVARYLRSSPLHLGKATLLRLARKWLTPIASRGGELVQLCAAPEAKMLCFGVGGAPAPDILTQWLLYTGQWQPALTRWLCATLRPGDVFIDVGANTGYFSLLAAARVGASGRVVAVEACPRTFEALRANLAQNPPLAKRVRAVQLAASDTRGHVTLYQHRNEPLYNTTVAGAGAGGVPAASDVWSVLQKSASLDASTLSAVSSLAADGACWREVRVPRAALDDLLVAEELEPRIVKIDVEGGESATLRGMEKVLRRTNLAVDIVVELSPRWLELQVPARRALLFPKRVGDVVSEERGRLLGRLPRRARCWPTCGNADSTPTRCHETTTRSHAATMRRSSLSRVSASRLDRAGCASTRWRVSTAMARSSTSSSAERMRSFCEPSGPRAYYVVGNS